MTTTTNMKITKEKNLIGKGKYIVKTVDQPLIKLVGRLKDKSSKLIYIHNIHNIHIHSYIYMLLYMNLMVTTNQKTYDRYRHTIETGTQK